MKTWFVITVVLISHQLHAQQEITREYIERKVCGDHVSFEACKETVLLELRRRFAEEVVGTYVESQSHLSQDETDEQFQQEIRSKTMSRATLEIINESAKLNWCEPAGQSSLAKG